MNDTESSGTMILLTYPTPTYTRLIVYVSICIAAYMVIRVFGDAIQAAVSHAEKADGGTGFPWQEAIPIITMAAAGFFAISEILFLLNYKLFQKRVEYDQKNVYITFSGQETVIPQSAITSFRLISTAMNRGLRGNYDRYAIEFNDEYPIVRFSVYRRAMRDLRNFEKILAINNPSAEIKHWATSLDPIIRLFKKKR